MPSFLKAMAACVADRSADQDTVGEARFSTITLEDAIDQREWLSKTLIDFNWTNIIDDQSTRICEPSLSHCDTRYVACMTYNMLEYILLDVTSFLDFLMKESYIYNTMALTFHDLQLQAIGWTCGNFRSFNCSDLPSFCSEAHCAEQCAVML